MDELEVRVHEEINDYVERFYGLTVRQIIAMIFVVGINVPTYLYLRGKINEDVLQFIIILIATPEVLWGFVKVQNMHAERFVRYWWRNLFLFAKPLQYQTDKDIELAKENKKRKKNKKVNRLSRAEKRMLKKQQKEEKIQAKIKLKEDKKARNEARELARAKAFFGMEETQGVEEEIVATPVKQKVIKQSPVTDITEEDLKLLQRLKMLEALKEQEVVGDVIEKEEDEESERQEENEKDQEE